MPCGVRDTMQSSDAVGQRMEHRARKIEIDPTPASAGDLLLVRAQIGDEVLQPIAGTLLRHENHGREVDQADLIEIRGTIWQVLMQKPAAGSVPDPEMTSW